ncbi:MAG: hemolysin family protein [Planctomycetota bacterium]
MTALPLILLGLGVAACLVASAFFAGSETAMISTDRTQLRSGERRGDRRAAVAESLLDHEERLLSTILVGNNLANVTATSLSTLLLAELVAAWGLPINEGALTTIVLTPVILIVGEIVPKALARGNANRLALLIAGPLRLSERLTHPLVAASSWLTEQALGLLGSKPTGDSPYVTREELLALAAIGEEHGVLDVQERGMIQSVLELRDRPVATVMVPLIDIASVEIGATVGDLEALAARAGYSRFPVHQDRVDNIVGIVSLADVLQAPDSESAATAPLAPFVRREVTYVPETKPVGDLLRELRYSHTPMAIVVDEHGGVVGLATSQDLVEEIVGRIRDLRLDRPRPVAAEDGSVFECDGKMDVEELLEHVDIQVDHTGFETAAGLIIKHTGRIPQAGETIDLGTHRAEVLEATSRRIIRLRFTRK